MRTGSSTINEFLSKQQADPDHGYTFTIASLALANSSVSYGAVGGYIARLKEAGIVKVVGSAKKGARLLDEYMLVSQPNLPVKENYSGRATTDRKEGGGGPTNKERVINMLMTAASEIERMHIGLADYTTEELLKEIGRRVKQDAGG